MRRILLTGSTGFVGRQILKSLIAKGICVTVTLRSEQKTPSGVEYIRTENLFSETVGFWEQNCRNHDAVIHAAWYTEHGRYLNAPENLDCLTGTIKLFQGAKAAGVSHFHGIGTCLEYDQKCNEALQKKPIPSDAPICPVTPYAAAKAAVYLALRNQQEEMQFAWSRLFYLYGEGEDPRRLVPYVNNQISKGLPIKINYGELWRDFLDVKVAASQIVDVTLNSRTGPHNICSGIPITVAKLAENIALKHNRNDLLKIRPMRDTTEEPYFLVGAPSFT